MSSWNHQSGSAKSGNAPEPHERQSSKGVSMIPLWSVVLAVAASAVVLFYFNQHLPPPEHRRPGWMTSHWMFVDTMVTGYLSGQISLDKAMSDGKKQISQI